MSGRILKIKTGYNPNSSSIGVDVVAFFTAGAAMAVLFNVIVSVVSSAAVPRAGAAEPPPDATPALGDARGER